MPLTPINHHSPKNEESSAKKAVEFQPSLPKYTFHDLILSNNTLDELDTVVNAQQCWKKVFSEWELETVMRDRKSIFVNLYGDPGTGKTMAAHAIASALQKPIICVNYAEIESKYVGETSKNLTTIFSNPSSKQCIVFFYEADAMLSKRVTNMNNATDVSVNQTRSVLLTLLNSYEGMVIFATNFISNYDPAFMRRIQYHIKFENPNAELREQLWRHYIPDKMPVCADLKELAKKYDGLSGSDISTAVLKAALKAARVQSQSVKQEYFEEAISAINASKKANQGERIITKSEIIPESEVPESIRKSAEKMR